MENKEKKSGRLEFWTGIITLLCGAAGLALFGTSYTTGYYVFGEMNSFLILLFILAGIGMEAFALFALRRWRGSFWVLFLSFAVTGLLMAGAVFLIGDRVEGIGNCIITDYDAGHGGEEAIYRSLAASGILLLGIIVNIIGSFAKSSRGNAETENKNENKKEN